MPFWREFFFLFIWWINGTDPKPIRHRPLRQTPILTKGWFGWSSDQKPGLWSWLGFRFNESRGCASIYFRKAAPSVLRENAHTSGTFMRFQHETNLDECSAWALSPKALSYADFRVFARFVKTNIYSCDVSQITQWNDNRRNKSGVQKSQAGHHVKSVQNFARLIWNQALITICE